MDLSNKFFLSNRINRDDFIEHITELKVLFNDYIQSANDVANILNAVYNCGIQIAVEVTRENVLKNGPERLQNLTREILNGLRSVKKDLKPIDDDVFRKLTELDVSFIQNKEKIRTAAAVFELTTAGLTGYKMFKAVAYKTVEKAGKREMVLTRPIVGTVLGALTFIGFAVTVDFFISLGITDLEARDFAKVNHKLKSYKDNEQKKIKAAAQLLEKQAEEFRRIFGAAPDTHDVQFASNL